MAIAEAEPSVPVGSLYVARDHVAGDRFDPVGVDPAQVRR